MKYILFPTFDEISFSQMLNVNYNVNVKLNLFRSLTITCLTLLLIVYRVVAESTKIITNFKYHVSYFKLTL